MPPALSSSSSNGGSSFSGTARPPRSRTPPPRAVAVPLDAEVLNPDTDFSLDLVKVQFKCTYATNFGQELRVVGGSPELGDWDVAKVRTCCHAASAVVSRQSAAAGQGNSHSCAAVSMCVGSAVKLCDPV
jgi:hypothetical protein